MTIRRNAGAFGAVLLLALAVGTPAFAKKDCGAWNNWCRPASGDWNAWCAGQSLPDVLSRMQPRSYFADPKWVGENFPFPKDPNQPAGPNAKSRSKKAER
jgi:hypothetical protein